MIIWILTGGDDIAHGVECGDDYDHDHDDEGGGNSYDDNDIHLYYHYLLFTFFTTNE